MFFVTAETNHFPTYSRPRVYFFALPMRATVHWFMKMGAMVKEGIAEGNKASLKQPHATSSSLRSNNKFAISAVQPV